MLIFSLIESRMVDIEMSDWSLFLPFRNSVISHIARKTSDRLECSFPSSRPIVLRVNFISNKCFSYTK